MTPSALEQTAPDFSIDECRPIKVVCIGAGFAGIIAGIRSVEPRYPMHSDHRHTYIPPSRRSVIIRQLQAENPEPGSYYL